MTIRSLMKATLVVAFGLWLGAEAAHFGRYLAIRIAITMIHVCGGGCL